MVQYPSLFVISLPRSLSSAIFHMSRLALKLSEPDWTSDGEILNLDRVKTPILKEVGSFRKFTKIDQHPNEIASIHKFLDKTVQVNNQIYKDVVQPFAMASWLKKHSFPVLIIERNLAEIAYPMVVRDWTYPANAATESGNDTLSKVISGLKAAELELQKIDGERIKYNELIYDETVLQKALQKLYPQKKVPTVRFIDDQFISYRDTMEDRTETPLYQQIVQTIAGSTCI